MSGLYPIVDLDACRRFALAPLDVAQVLLEVEPPLLQLRAKGLGPRQTLELLRQLATLMQGSSTRLVANDRPDLALMAGCPAVHLGQKDLPIAELRKFSAELRVGVSTHTLAELEIAISERPWYVAYGPVFSTASKLDAEPCVGLAGLAAAAALARASGTVLVAIGGIDEGNIADVAPFADAVAVISALLGPNLAAVRARAKALTALTGRGELLRAGAVQGTHFDE